MDSKLSECYKLDDNLIEKSKIKISKVDIVERDRAK